METGFVILAVVTLVLCATVGILIAKLTKRPEETQGTIYAYYSDSASNPSLLLEQSVPINDIASRKQVIFDVVVIQQNSHK